VSFGGSARQQCGTGVALLDIQRIKKRQINRKGGENNEEEISSDGDGADFGRNFRPQLDR
jgi:hypothetical protein